MTMSTSTPYLLRLAASTPSRLLSPLIGSPGTRPQRQRSSDAGEESTAQTLSETAPSAQLSKLTMTVHRDATSMVVTASGALDTYTVDAFWNAVERPDIASNDLFVDLDAVSLIDSAGLHALRTLMNRAHASGRGMQLVCRRPDINGALAIAGLKAVAAVQPWGGASDRHAQTKITTTSRIRGNLRTRPSQTSTTNRIAGPVADPKPQERAAHAQHP
jgi:anti-anti-sigma factor